MKVALLLIAVLGLANAAVILPVKTTRQQVAHNHVTSRGLNELLQQFIDFIPFEECQLIVEKYLATNTDVQAAYAFLLSDDFKTLTDKVVSMPEYQNFLKYLYDAGVDIYTYQNIFRKILGLPPINPPKIHILRSHSIREESGIILMIREILATLPISDIKSWFYNVCLPDPDFQDLLLKLTSQEFRDLVEAVNRTPEYNELTDILRAQGIDVDEIEKVIADFISGQFVKRSANRSLDDLLKQFASFIPFDTCKAIVEKYLATDPDVQAAYAFLLSDEFKSLVAKVENKPEYIEFLKYLSDAGLDIYTYENIIRRMFNLPPREPPRRMARESGLIKMVLEIMAVLPVDEIEYWFNNVCIKDPEFQALIQKIISPEFMELVETVVTSPEYKELTDVLRAQGIDVEAIEKAIDDFFNNRPGLRRNSRSLKSLLSDFVAFIPVDELLNIVLTYLQEDEDVQRVFIFLQGEDFRNMVIKLEGLTELYDFLAWVNDHEIDIYTYVNTVLEFLGIPPVSPPLKHHVRRPSTRSLKSLIDDILAILPVDDIISWYLNTCQNDPEFIDLLGQLRSDSFKVIVQNVKDDPAFPIMHNGLASMGINIEAVEKFLHDFFGW